MILRILYNILYHISDRLGRRILCGGLMIFGGICCIVSMLLLEFSDSNDDALAVSGKFSF